MRKIMIAGAMLASLGLAACVGDVPDPVPAPAPASAAVETPEPLPSATAEMPPEAEVTEFVIELTWQNASQEDRNAICDYYRNVPDVAVEKILESAGGDQLTAKIVEDFLDAKC